MATATRRAKKSALAKDPNQDIDPDDSALETLLESLQSGDLSLGELRRDHGLNPEAVVRLMAKHPGLIGECPITEKLRIQPGVSTTIQRVKAQSKSSGASVQPSPTVQLELDRDKLLKLLEFPRHSSWLAEFYGLPIERIREIDRRWPGLGILVVSSDLGQKYQYLISLSRPLEIAPLPEPVVTETPQLASPPPERLFHTSDLDPKELARMMWRPGKPQMSSGRRAHPENMQFRRRTPLVKL